MFKNERDEYQFKWETLGQIQENRPDVGTDVPVIIFRLYDYTLRDSLIKHLDVHKANHILKEAGFNAGVEFFNNVIAVTESTGDFYTDFANSYKYYKLGVLAYENFSEDRKNLHVLISQDLNSSGIAHVAETICEWDEGFICGVLTSHFKSNFKVEEIECWGTGHAFCRFVVTKLG
jgi:predicted hydrocarbon binding protein